MIMMMVLQFHLISSQLHQNTKGSNVHLNAHFKCWTKEAEEGKKKIKGMIPFVSMDMDINVQGKNFKSRNK